MFEGVCHCGEVRWQLHFNPAHLTRCNCSICRRYATLWTHATEADLTVLAGEASTETYLYGDKDLEFHRCPSCGVVVYWRSHMPKGRSDGDRLAVNMNLVEPPTAIAHLPIRTFDGAHTWRFLD